VAAIGHPEGQSWTYTKGIVSQIRPDFAWSTGQGESHRATVIQTQTPINPGNSGGPLLSDDGRIVGINSFRATEGEGLNFAVSAKDISAFLNNQADGMAALQSCDEPKNAVRGPQPEQHGVHTQSVDAMRRHCGHYFRGARRPQGAFYCAGRFEAPRQARRRRIRSETQRNQVGHLSLGFAT